MKNILAGMGVATVAGVLMLSQTAFAAQPTAQQQAQKNQTHTAVEKTLKTAKTTKKHTAKKITKKKLSKKTTTSIKS